jgi:hypothetical protein
MAASSQHLMEQAESLYEQYGRPLGKEQWREYVAIAQDGRLALGRSRLEALDKALAQFGPGSFHFKVGDRVVGRWRRTEDLVSRV